MRCVIAAALMLCDPALKVIRRTNVMAASAAQDVNPSHIRFAGSAGTRTRNQRLKRALLYQLSYRPVKIQFVIAKRFFNPEPTPKAFGAALPIELPTRAENLLNPDRLLPQGCRATASPAKCAVISYESRTRSMLAIDCNGSTVAVACGRRRRFRPGSGYRNAPAC
jgi:hypothetical protein